MKIDKQTYDDITGVIEAELGLIEYDDKAADRVASLVLGRLGIEKPEPEPKVRITTGKWIVDVGAMSVGIMTEKGYIAMPIHGPDTNHIPTGIPSPEAIANARLIAAAPRLAELGTMLVDRVLDNNCTLSMRSILIDMKARLVEAGYIDEG